MDILKGNDIQKINLKKSRFIILKTDKNHFILNLNLNIPFTIISHTL